MEECRRGQNHREVCRSHVHKNLGLYNAVAYHPADYRASCNHLREAEEGNPAKGKQDGDDVGKRENFTILSRCIDLIAIPTPTDFVGLITYLCKAEGVVFTSDEVFKHLHDV